jgi:TonB family protein
VKSALSSDADNAGHGVGDTRPACATCGRALTPGDSAAGLCAACLLATALSSDADSPEDDDGSLTTLAAGTMLGSFRIVRVLGRGGMATVYEARDGRLERAVALKVLPPEFLHDVRFAERFEQEARVVAALEHPNIVPIYASGIDDGIPWMSMRLLTGGTIGTLLEDGRPDARQIVRLLRAVASGLDYAHAHGVVHRDIKPTNILLDRADGVCVGDFGLAYMLEASPRVTRSGLLAGTPQYMAPEQALGKAVDHRCDIYSLAMVAYEMFVGVTPFTADSPVAILLKHVHDPMPEPPEHVVPRPVMRAIHKGAAKEPAERWPSATAFVDALEAAVSARQDRRVYGFIRSIQRAPRRRVRWLSAAGGAVLAAAATVGWLVPRAPRAPAEPDRTAVDVPASPGAMGAAPIPSLTKEMGAPAENPAASPQRVPGNGPQATGTTRRIAAPLTESASPPLAAAPAAVSPTPTPAPPHATAGGDIPSQSTTDALIPGLPSTVSAPSLIADIVTAPERIRTVSPEYPQIARAAQLEGDVLLEAIVTGDGKVTNVSVIRSVHPLLDESARKAVLQYEYTPARRNGVPESTTVRLTVSFRMR